MLRSLKRLVRLSLTRLNGESLGMQHDTLAMVRLRPLMEPYGYVPATTFALRPSALELVVNEVLLSKVSAPRVLELGCGYSTLCLAEALRRIDGHLVSVESDHSWLETTQRLLGTHNDNVEFVHAPLQPVRATATAQPWYDLEVLQRALSEQRFDFLLVDGPFGGLAPLARYPAVPMLKEHLTDGCVVFLDDIGRPDEAEIARRWCAEHDFTLEIHRVRGSIGILRRGAGSAVYL